MHLPERLGVQQLIVCWEITGRLHLPKPGRALPPRLYILSWQYLQEPCISTEDLLKGSLGMRWYSKEHLHGS